MKILVCISKVPDTTTKIQFTNDNKEFDTNNVQFILNPYDEWYALVRALEIKEAGTAEQVTVINVGPAENDQVIRKALAIGADDAVRVNMDPKDTYATAVQIAQYAKDNDFTLIMTGKETIDYNGSSLGGMVAELMDAPFISYASHLDMEGDTAVVTREIEGGSEVMETGLPLVVSAQKGMAEARIPTMRGIMGARTKPLNVVEPVAASDLTAIAQYELPPEKGDVKLIDPENVQELIDLLHNEAKVI